MARPVNINLIELAVEAVNACGGNLAHAAQQLGIKRDCLRSRIRWAMLKGYYVPSVESRFKPDVAEAEPTFSEKLAIIRRRLEIRQSWSDGEKRLRTCYRVRRWTPPVPGQSFTEAIAEARFS